MKNTSFLIQNSFHILRPLEDVFSVVEQEHQRAVFVVPKKF